MQVNSNLSVGHALVVELFITFELVFTVFATCDPKRNDLKGSAGLAIGFAVCIGHLFAVSQYISGPCRQHMDAQSGACLKIKEMCEDNINISNSV